MCYNYRDHRLDEEAHSRLRQHEEEEARARRGEEAQRSQRVGKSEEKPLTEKVREMVGSAR